MKYITNINTRLISSIFGIMLSATFVAAFMAPSLAFAGGSYYGGGHGGSHESYYPSYYPTSEASYYPTTHTSSANANANANSNSNTNTITINNTVLPSGSYSYNPYNNPIVYAQQPTYYATPVLAPTYYQDYNGYSYNNNNSGYNYNNYNYSAPLTVTCSTSNTSVPLGATVSWNANVSGGSGYYTYQWSGSDQIYGSNSSITVSYNTPGIKYATVTVNSNGQTITQSCYNTVTVSQPNYAPNQYQYGNNNYSGQGNLQNGSLVVACAAGARTVNVGTPVTWSAEATGGNGQYVYSWTGSDGLSGSRSSVATSYETTGTKTASVTVTSGGNSVTSACDNTVNVVPAGQNIASGQLGTTAHTNGANGSSNSTLSANSLFSLGNLPWGWVALLVIIVLLVTVTYLIFNKSKI